jgi:hypothetical protein
MTFRKLLPLALVAAFAICGPAHGANYIGDYAPGDTVYCDFGTVRPSTGASFTLAGTPSLAVYKNAGTTESTTGVTLNADFDAKTGLNYITITTASDGTFYAAGGYFTVAIAAGTVDSVSVVAQPVCSFTLNRVSALRPTTAARTLDVSSTGEAGLDIGNISTCLGSVPALGITDCGTGQGATGTTLQMRSAAAFADNEARGWSCLITSGTGVGQSQTVSSSVGSTDTLTMSGTWTTTPSGFTYTCFGTAQAASIAADIWGYSTGRTLTAATNITSTGGTIPITSSRVDASVGAYQSGLAPLQPTVAGRPLDVSATGEAGVDWANVGSPSSSVTLSNTTVSPTQSVASVTGAVASVGAGGITAASLGADAITAAKVAADVTPEIQAGLATASALGTVGTNVTSLQAAVAALNNLSSTQVRDIMIEDQGGGITLACALSAITAYVTGDLSTSGGNSTYKDPSGTEVRITGIVSSPGNRLGTITCPTLP